MKYIRVLYRLPGVILVTLVSYSINVLGILFSPFGANIRNWRRYGLRLWGKGMAKVMGIKINVIGTPPKAPFYLVSNHLSYVDIFIITGITGSVFVAKAEMRKWPIFGFFMATIGMVFVDRGKLSDIKRVNAEVTKSLEKGYGITVFPEGTTSPGYSTLPFRSSLLAYPAAMELPVYSASLNYDIPNSDKPVYKTVVWWGDITFLQHFFKLITIKNCTGTIHFNEKPIINSDRKILAKELQQSILDIYEPVISEEEFNKHHNGENVSRI